jgi:hypothetical protein
MPRSVAPITGEALISYLTRLACANHLTLTEVLTILPSWFSTKISNRDDRAQHHMLIPASAEALRALASLTSVTPTNLACALPAFGTADAHNPVRAAAACGRCAARRGIHQPVPVHLPAHHKVCTRHGIWLSDVGQPQPDLAACPEIVTAQHRANRLLRRCTPQELILAYQATARAIPPWPPSPAAIPLHWRQRLLTLQTANHRYGTPTDHDAYTHAAIYPDAIALAAAALNHATHARSSKIHWRTPRHLPASTSPDPSPIRHSGFLTPGQSLAPRKIFCHRTRALRAATKAGITSPRSPTIA